MKNLTSFLFTLLIAGFTISVLAEEEWQASTLTEATIQKVQAAKVDYKKCFFEKIQKSGILDKDSRQATDEVIKQCEPVLSKVREIYLGEKVPGAIADRHMRQIRTQTARDFLQSLMFEQAARNAGKP